MRKTNNKIAILALLLFGFFAFAFEVKADQVDAREFKLICEKESLEPGQTTNCYLVARVLENDSEGKGLYSVIASIATKSMTVDKASFKAGAGYGSSVLKETAQVGAQFSNIKKSDGTGVTCEDLFTNFTGKTQTFCGAFYSADAAARSIIKSVSSENLTKDHTVIGSFTLTLDKNAGASCGEICIKISKQTNANENLVSAGDITNGASTEVAGCQEIQVVKSTDEPNPPDGNFISYAILGAGALIAICAVLVAQKNNKFYKV